MEVEEREKDIHHRLPLLVRVASSSPTKKKDKFFGGALLLVWLPPGTAHGNDSADIMITRQM